jgi:hypothetical protein
MSSAKAEEALRLAWYAAYSDCIGLHWTTRTEFVVWKQLTQQRFAVLD